MSTNDDDFQSDYSCPAALSSWPILILIPSLDQVRRLDIHMLLSNLMPANLDISDPSEGRLGRAVNVYPGPYIILSVSTSSGVLTDAGLIYYQAWKDAE